MACTVWSNLCKPVSCFWVCLIVLLACSGSHLHCFVNCLGALACSLNAQTHPGLDVKHCPSGTVGTQSVPGPNWQL